MSTETRQPEKNRRPERPRKEVLIRPARGIGLGDFSELWHCRDLLRSMVRRRTQARYNNLYLGLFWVTARPLLMTLIFVFIKKFSTANMGGGVAYPAYLFSGLMVWFYLAGSINETASALERDAGLVQKVYFPRLISPLTPMLANLVELVIGALILIPLMAYFELWPDWKLLLLPLVIVQIQAMILGVGLIFSALNLISRDWSNLLSLILYVGLFMSPVIYGPERLPESVRLIYDLNPAVGSLMGMRSCLFAPMEFPWASWGYSVAFSLASLLLGLKIFHRVEHKLLDQL